jgi:hypothetical protein
MTGEKNGKKSKTDKETKVTINYDGEKGGFQFDAGQLLQALHDGAVVKEEKITDEKADAREFFDGEKPNSNGRCWNPIRAGLWLHCVDQLLEERFAVMKTERYNNQGKRGSPLLYNDFDIGYEEKTSLLIAGDKYVIDMDTDSHYILTYMPDPDGDLRLVVWFNPLTNTPKDFWDIVEEYFHTHGPLKSAVFTPGWRFLPRHSDEAKMLVLEPEVVSKIDLHLYKWMDTVDSYRARGLSTSRGIILAGSPGVGKTLFVKSLVSKVTDHTIIVVSSDDISHRGDIKGIFKLAGKLSPSLVILEDAEFCSLDRSFHYTPMIGEILQAMDGIAPNDGVITIATTNLVETLDPAIRDRPGRFDHVIQIGTPSLKTRQKLLETYAVKFKIDPKVSMIQVAQSTDNWTGAFLKELLVNAELRSKDGVITVADIQDANDDIAHGREWANTPTHLPKGKNSDSNSYV